MLQLLKGFIIANTRPGFRSCIDQVIRCSPRWFKSILSTLHWPCGMLHPVVISDSSIQHQETASRFTARWQRKRHCNGPECERMKVKTETSTIVWKTWYVFPLLNLDSKCPCCWSKYMYHKQHSFLPSQVVLPVWITKRWRNLDDNDPKVVDLRNSGMKIKIHQKSVANLFASRVGVNFQTVNFFFTTDFPQQDGTYRGNVSKHLLQFQTKQRCRKKCWENQSREDLWMQHLYQRLHWVRRFVEFVSLKVPQRTLENLREKWRGCGKVLFGRIEMWSCICSFLLISCLHVSFCIVSGILRFERSAEKREDVKKRDSDEISQYLGLTLLEML